MELAGAFDTEL